MDRIIFGDNQFFGINHMSEEKARAQAMRFRNTRAILDVVDAAYDAGIHSFMFTTHALVEELCEHFRVGGSRYEHLTLLPAMPYAHKYANAIAEKGVLQTLIDATEGNKLSMLKTGAGAVMKQDPRGFVKILVDAEMRVFDGLATPIIFLQNIVVDLLLGLGGQEAFATFADHIRARYDAEPGFITMNLPTLVDALHSVGLQNPIVCSSINKIGHLMNPSREACEHALRTKQCRPIAMSVFASGAVRPKEAIEYVAGLPKIGAVLFGASSRGNIEESKWLIDRAFGARVS